MSCSYNSSEEDPLKILIATDIHLGYNHMDPIMGRDSLITFEEVLQHAKQNDVDLILLGGDLFHDNKPPRHVIFNCMELFKIYNQDTREKKKLHVRPASDSQVSMINTSRIFSIHGNHDEPTGPQYLSVMDLLHSAELVNFFGKTTSVEKINVKPLLLKKGVSQVALYGVGSIRADKLRQMYNNKCVVMEPPDQDPDDWFNIFVLHQDRNPHTDIHVEESFIDKFVDLVIWGHEHESKKLQKSSGAKWIYQPGSTIATQFKNHEQKQKHVGLLTVYGKKEFNLTPIPLETVRQLYIDDHTPMIYESESPRDDAVKDRLLQDCKNKVEALLVEAENSRKPKQPKEPRIRIRILQDNCSISCSTTRFGQQFVGRVANPDTILAFGRKMNRATTSDSNRMFPSNSLSSTFTVETLLEDELQNEEYELRIFKRDAFLQAVKCFVKYGDPKAVTRAFKEELEKEQQKRKAALPCDATSSMDMAGIRTSMFKHHKLAVVRRVALIPATRLILLMKLQAIHSGGSLRHAAPIGQQ